MRQPISALSTGLLLSLLLIHCSSLISSSSELSGATPAQESLMARTKTRRPVAPHRGSGRREVSIRSNVTA